MAKFSKYLSTLSIVAVLIGGYFVLSKKSAEAPIENKTVVIEENASAPAVKEEKSPVPASTREDATSTRGGEKPIVNPEVLPEKISISVPFTSQAPFANWDIKHEEACEEASLIMVKYYLDKKTLTPEIAEREILSMIDYEIKNLGHYADSDAAEMVKIAGGFYGIKNMKVIYDFKKADIKKYLALGKPIIVPAAGRLLGNPNFTAPGPPYHALVLTGYDGDTIMANDPGTRKGHNYTYDLDVLYTAIHDFPGDLDKINQGRKAMIILE